MIKTNSLFLTKLLINLLLLETKNGVTLKVTEVDGVTFGLDLRVFPDQQPTDVGEEESSGRVVGVSISFGVLVMHTMVSGPVNYCVLDTRRSYYKYVFYIIVQEEVQHIRWC